MKFLKMMLVIMFILGAAHAMAQETNQVLVVYYSRTGNTRMVAEQIAERFDGDILELKDTKKRTGPFGFTSAGKDALAKNTTVLEPLDIDPDPYAVILIGTPSWFGNITPAVRTFVEEYDLKGKTVGVFATTHLTGVEKTVEQLSSLVAGDQADVVGELPLREKEFEDETVLRKKIEAFYQAVRGPAATNAL
jgi:flavodoxin